MSPKQKKTYNLPARYMQRHEQQASLSCLSLLPCPNAPAAYFHVVSPFGIRQEPNRNWSFFFQSAAWSYLCKGAVCKVSGELSLHHQSQSGPFISIALHVCISDSDPACVSLGPRACFTASVCILLRETQRRERGSAPYVWRRAWCCFLKVE